MLMHVVNGAGSRQVARDVREAQRLLGLFDNLLGSLGQLTGLLQGGMCASHLDLDGELGLGKTETGLLEAGAGLADARRGGAAVEDVPAGLQPDVAAVLGIAETIRGALAELPAADEVERGTAGGLRGLNLGAAGLHELVADEREQLRFR